jgi:hypothetical protein
MTKCVIKRRFYRFAGFDEACVDEKEEEEEDYYLSSPLVNLFLCDMNFIFVQQRSTKMVIMFYAINIA